MAHGNAKKASVSDALPSTPITLHSLASQTSRERSVSFDSELEEQRRIQKNLVNKVYIEKYGVSRALGARTDVHRKLVDDPGHRDVLATRKRM